MVALVRNYIHIPVIANGDIIDEISAKQALEESQADGVMIGRGSLGKPWILRDIDEFINTGQISEKTQTNRAKCEIAKRHLEYMLEFYEPSTAVKLARKVLMYYCYGTHNASKYRQKINTIETISAIFDILHEIFLT